MTVERRLDFIVVCPAPIAVIPVKTGIQCQIGKYIRRGLDSHFRGNDDSGMPCCANAVWLRDMGAVGCDRLTEVSLRWNEA